VLTCWALTGEPGKFSFEAKEGLPPMFQAFPLQASLPALAIDGIRRCDPTSHDQNWAGCLFARHNPRGGNLDRAGMSPLEMKVHTLLDGNLDVAAIAAKVEASVDDVANVVRGLELAGLAERKNTAAGASILVLEEDPEAVRTIRAVLGPEGLGHQLKVVQDRIGAQLLLRRNRFQLVMMGLDRPDQELAFRAFKEHTGPATRFAGISGIDDESELNRLDEIGLDGVLHRPISEADLRTTTKYLLETATVAGVA
jgi:CheY-like chemotaxis protein